MISDIREIKQIFRDLSAAYKKYGFIDDVKQFAKKEADLDEPLLLFVVGEGNFGKSTLVNTLIGKSYAAVSRLPRTWRVDVYRKSRKNYAELYFADRSVKKVSVARAINICKKYEKEGKEWKADLYQVVWHVADINIPESVSIVDTPGFAQFRSSDDEREVSILGHEGLRVRVRDIFSAYYYRADVVLWMFNARRINDKDTVEAVSKLQHLNKKVIGCISYFDFVPQDRANEIIDDAEKYFGSLTQTFVPLYLNGKT